MSFGLTTYVPNANTKAYYKLENVNDSSANAKNLTNRGTVTFAQGRFTNCAQFGSSNSSKYLDIADTLGLDTYNAGTWTVSMWSYLRTAPASGEAQNLFGVVDVSKAQINIQYMNNSGTFRFQLVVFNGLTAATATVNFTLTTSVWNNIFLIKNGTTFLVYVNGALVGSNTYIIVDNSPTRASQVCLARDVFDSADFYKGDIDEVIVEAGVWSATAVRKYYSQAVGRYGCLLT